MASGLLNQTLGKMANFPQKNARLSIIENLVGGFNPFEKY